MKTPGKPPEDRARVAAKTESIGRFRDLASKVMTVSREDIVKEEARERRKKGKKP